MCFSATSFMFHLTNYAKPLSASVFNVLTQAALQELYPKNKKNLETCTNF